MKKSDLEQVSQEVVKRKRPKKSEQMSVQTTPDENSKYVRHVLASYDLPPLDLNDPKQVQDRIEWYFNHCAEDGMKPTVAGICNSLGIDRLTFYRWGEGERRGKNSDYGNMVKKRRRLFGSFGNSMRLMARSTQ